MSERVESFRERLTGREALMGTFMKSPSPIVAEVLGLSALDAIAIDCEHAPFGRLELDLCIGALRAADMPSLVRLADDTPTSIRNALDSGASGIVVPHVTSPEQAAAIVRAAHFGDGGRGYAGSPRAAGYGRKSMADHLADSREQTSVILQIEDIPALQHVAQIAEVDGVDCLFVGRIDLAVAMNTSASDESVITAVKNICEAARESEPAVGMFTPNVSELPDWIEAGASLFLLASDQSMIIESANALAQSMR